MILKDVDWKSNEWKDIEFEEELKITGFTRGRSAANISAISAEGNRHYTIFLIDFFDMLENGDIKNMIVSGIFKIKKRGRSFGVRLKSTPYPKKIINNTNFPIERPVPEYI